MDSRVKDRRLYFGLTQREIARQVGITSTAMSEIERGVHIPSAVVAILIARELKTSVEDLWGALADEYRPKNVERKK
jgi:putative transcriptional regulator